MPQAAVTYRPFTLIALTMVALLLAGCSLINQEADRATAVALTAQAGDAATVAPTETAAGPTLLGTPIPAPTEEPTPTGESPRVNRLLPGAFYFIAGDGQIVRVEADLITQSIITAESAPVTDFGVNPVDGRLAYVAGNDLVESDPFGAGRILKVGRPVPAEDDFAGRINGTISNPVFSPDGTQLAFGLGGIMVMPVGPGNTFTPVVASDPYPDGDDFADSPIVFYRPDEWSPDGSRILAEFSYYPEAGGLAVVEASTGEVTFITSPEGIACCNPSWSVDGTTIYFASQFAGLIQPGFWRADAASGTGEALVPGVPTEGPIVANLVAFPVELAPGRIFAYHRTVPAADLGSPPPMTLSQFDGRSFIPLRGDMQQINEVLWSPDGRGALVVLAGEDMNSRNGPLVWVPADGGPLLPLDLVGQQPRWAATDPLPLPEIIPTVPVTTTGTLTPEATEAPAATATAAPEPTTVCFDAASFVYDVTIPDGTVVDTGESFVKTWQLRNDGSCTWDEGYVLAFARGEQLGGPPTVALPASVAPGETVDISVPLVGSESAGVRQGWWQLEAPDGTRFGPQIFVLVNVVAP